MPTTFDRVWETTTTTGTGAVTLAGAVAGYQTFAVVGNGGTCFYCITDDSDWEVGLGTYSTTGPTLTRTTVYASTNSNAAVSFGAGSKDVFLTAPAQLLNRIENITSGQVSSGAIQGALGSVRNIASGTIGSFDMASGGITSGHIASGQLGTYHHTSGATVTRSQFTGPFVSGTSWNCLTEENISGTRAVAMSQSGRLRVAMAGVSGRMPAIGVVVDNVASGIQANVYTQGVFQTTSGMANYSGHLGQPVFVGRSGHIVQQSGSFQSGGFASGDIHQRIGVPCNSGGVVIHMSEAYKLASG